MMDVRLAMVILVGVAVMALIVIITYQQRRTSRLRRQFGPEYDHVLEERRSRARAEAELKARCQRVQALHLRALDAGSRADLVKAWQVIQARFANDPRESVAAADHLVITTLSAIGYPLQAQDEGLADMSVHHAYVLDDYRTAREIAARAERGPIGTEDLRRCIICYRALLEDVAGEWLGKRESLHERAA